MTRTFPTDGLSPCDFYDSVAPSRALGFFHWDLSGSNTPAADGMVVLKYADASTHGGYCRALLIDMDITGTRSSGSAWTRGLDIQMAVTGDYWRYLSGINISYEVTDGIDCKMVHGIYMYLGDVGSGTANVICCLDLEREITTAADYQDTFIKFYVHGSGTAGSIFHIEGAPYIANYLFEVPQNNIPFSSASSHGTETNKVACKIGTQTVYLYFFGS